MANDLSKVIPQLLAQGLMALRQNAIMPRLVNRKYEDLAGEKGSTIDVPIPSAIAATDVAPGATPPSTADIAPTSVPVVMDQWKEAAFYMTDKDILEAMSGTIPMQASEAIKSIANIVDEHLLDNYKSFYGIQGIAGTTPFGSGTTFDATQLRKVLNNQLAPLGDRHVVMDPDAEAAALDIRAFQDASYSGDMNVLLEGQLNRKLGFQWWMDQNVLTHTAGIPGGTPLVDGAHSAGVNSILMNGGGAAGTYVVGDIVTFAGHDQTYVITTDVVLTGGGVGTLPIEPALQEDVANDAAIVLTADHVVNLGFHRDAIAFATRPLETVDTGLGTNSSTLTDPVTGLVLRLEVTREHKRTRYAYDILYGSAVPRGDLGARLLG